MKKLDTSALSRITDPKLGIAYKKELYTHTVVLALEEFLSENFRGLIKVKYDKIENTIIKISAEYLAYLIKLLLRQADGRAFITVYASMTQGGLELSFEACSEAPMHRDPWKSDIEVSINGKLLGVWTSPCDCGGRHGRLTPAWWPELSTQFGFLKAWRVTHDGSFVEDERVGDAAIDELGLKEQNYISVRIGVPADAQNVGGINLFGERFGDHPQGIVLRLGYRIKG
jgi:hypothetical protein